MDITRPAKYIFRDYDHWRGALSPATKLIDGTVEQRGWLIHGSRSHDPSLVNFNFLSNARAEYIRYRANSNGRPPPFSIQRDSEIRNRRVFARRNAAPRYLNERWRWIPTISTNEEQIKKIARPRIGRIFNVPRT